jgi:ubiquinone/menaquinone biosynthesis C-methylase UbiE
MTIKSLEEASLLVKNMPFDRDKWIEIYTYTSIHNPWARERIRKMKESDVRYFKSIDILEEAEQLAEKNFPFERGKVLEIGAHVGRFAVYKVVNFPEIFLSCVDASEYLTTFGIENEKRLDVSNRIDRRVMLAEELIFSDVSFDRVYAFETMEHVGDLHKSLSEISRVLKYGGDFVFSLPFGNFDDGGFHTQKHTKTYWIEALSDFFKVDEDLLISVRGGMVGKVTKCVCGG